MMHLAPNGRVFNSGPGAVTRYLDTSGTGAWTVVADRQLFREYGSSVMYADGKILLTGGGDPPTNTAEVIDLNLPSPAWRSVAPMAYARRQLNATLLPDGKVLVTGGTSGPGFNNSSTPVMASELWNPVTETWTTMASGAIPRLYHSGALLLPDGRVFATGGDGYNQAEVYSPPYLFRGARPAIATAPASVAYGQTFFVETPNATSITQVTWVGLSSVTHAFNMNQRINLLSFSQAAGGLNVVAPASPTLAPIGHYMLFILNSDGVPSVAKIVRLNNGSGPLVQFFDALLCSGRWTGIFSDSRGKQLRRRLDRSMERRESEHHVLKQQPAHRHDSRQRSRCRWNGTGPGDESRRWRRLECNDLHNSRILQFVGERHVGARRYACDGDIEQWQGRTDGLAGPGCRRGTRFELFTMDLRRDRSHHAKLDRDSAWSGKLRIQALPER